MNTKYKLTIIFYFAVSYVFCQESKHNFNIIHDNQNNYIVSTSNDGVVDTLIISSGTIESFYAYPDPKSEFNNHAIVKYSGKYYDPSYGSPIQNTSNDWENLSLEGFGAKLRFSRIESGLTKIYELVWVGHLNTPTQQSNITP